MSDHTLCMTTARSTRPTTHLRPKLRGTAWLIAGLLTGSVMATENASNDHEVEIIINEVAMLDFSSASPVTFEIVAPAQAGDIPEVQSAGDSSRRLFFTSIVNHGETRTIRVAHDDSVPAGLRLRLQASGPSGTGTIGTTNGNAFASPAVITSNGNQVVVSGIGSGYTSTGSSAGAELNYSLSISNTPNDLSSLVAQTGEVTLTYTMGVD